MTLDQTQDGGVTPIAPQHGKDAYLVFHVDRKDKPTDNNEQVVDYYELTPFHEIKAGDVIVEKILATKGTPGRDEHSHEIPARPGKDVVFSPQNNIVEVGDAAKIIYKAKVDGILTFDSKTADVQEVLNISSDVDFKTGNIYTNQNVCIRGDVKGGFIVDCGGDLYINGSVENGAKIKCQGNLIVARGAFGQETEIEVYGQAEIGFLQNVNITVNGHLLVHKYIYDSRALCRGQLTVLGNGVKGNGKGSVVGGCVNSVGSMELHSVGSAMAQTHLICGIDAQRVVQISELENLSNILMKKISSLQNRIGFDLSDPNIGQKLERFPVQKKMQIKDLLIEFKNASLERENVLRKIDHLNSFDGKKDVNDVKLLVHKHIIPNICLEIGKVSVVIEQPLKSKVFQLHEGKIIYK